MDTVNISKMGFLEIIGKSFKNTFSNIKTFLKCLAMPLFGQVAGLALALCGPLVLSVFKDFNPILYILLVFLFTGVGIVIFCVYFWKFALAYAATISMSKNIIMGDTAIDANVHIDAIKQRQKPYVVFLLLMCLIHFVLSWLSDTENFLAWVLSTAVLIYTALAPQAFVLNHAIRPQDAILASAKTVNGNFWQTLWLTILGTTAALILASPVFLPFVFAVVAVGSMFKKLAYFAKDVAEDGFVAFNETLYQEFSLTFHEISVFMMCLVGVFVVLALVSVYLVPFCNMFFTYWYLKLEEMNKLKALKEPGEPKESKAEEEPGN